MSEIVFATGFGCISDVVTGPDGLLYITSLSDGTIYRIVPQEDPNSIGTSVTDPSIIYIILAAIIVAIIAVYAIRRKKSSKKINL